MRSLATLFVEHQLTENINLDIAIEEFANRGKKSYCVKNCSFHFRNIDGPNFLHFFYYFPYMYVIFAFCLTVTMFEFFVVYLKHTIFEHVRVL